MTIEEKWFNNDRELLLYSKQNPYFQTLEWKKYERKEDARPLEDFPR